MLHEKHYFIIYGKIMITVEAPEKIAVVISVKETQA